MLPIYDIDFTGDVPHAVIIALLGILVVLSLWGRWRA